MIGILNVPWGNKISLERALGRLEIPFQRINNPFFIDRCESLIFPGVGHFSSLLSFLDEGWRGPLMRYKKPLLGICLGMHSLFKESEESKGKGLGLLQKKVRLLPQSPCPHMGWNTLEGEEKSPLLKGLMNEDFYFVHSYAVTNVKESLSLTNIDGLQICSAVAKDNFFGVQFHPEKSGEAGMQLLKNFWEMT